MGEISCLKPWAQIWISNLISSVARIGRVCNCAPFRWRCRSHSQRHFVMLHSVAAVAHCKWPLPCSTTPSDVDSKRGQRMWQCTAGMLTSKVFGRCSNALTRFDIDCPAEQNDLRSVLFVLL